MYKIYSCLKPCTLHLLDHLDGAVYVLTDEQDCLTVASLGIHLAADLVQPALVFNHLIWPGLHNEAVSRIQFYYP